MRSVLLLLSPIKLSPVHFFYKNFGIGNTFTPVSYFFSGLDPFLSAFLCALLGFALINSESGIPLDFFWLSWIVSLRCTRYLSAGLTCWINDYLSDLFKLTVYLRNYLFVFLVVAGKYVVYRNLFDYWLLLYKFEVDLLSCNVGDIGSEDIELGGENIGRPFLV